MSRRNIWPFRYGANRNWTGIILFLIINLIVLTNALLHPPSAAYDSHGHVSLVEAYSEGRLPASSDSIEHHSPPLPYLLPAATNFVLIRSYPEGISLPSGISPTWLRFTNAYSDNRLALVAKVGQLQMVGVSLLLTFYVAKLGKLVAPKDPNFQSFSLALLGMLPVYYRGFTMMRGEPFVALFTVISLYYFLKIFSIREISRWNIIMLSFAIGLGALSRHFGILLGPGVVLGSLVLYNKHKDNFRQLVSIVLVAGIIGGIFAGLFYVPYFVNNGYSMIPTAGRLETYPEEFSLSNQPLKFYTSLSLDELFTDPVRPSFLNQLFPIFYSEVFGDYWAHFLIFARDMNTDSWVSASRMQENYANAFYFGTADYPPEGIVTNRLSFAPYLGKLNLVAILFAGILLGGLIMGVLSIKKLLLARKDTPQDAMNMMAVVLILLNGVLFFYFLVMYPDFEGSIVKAVYVLQIFPLLALLGASFIIHFSAKWAKFSKAIWVYLTIFGLFALPAFISHYIWYELN